MSDIDYIKQSWSELCENEQEKETQSVRRVAKEKMKSDSRENSSSRKKSKPNNWKNDSEKTSSRPLKKPLELETDPEILQRRQKTIDYGKNTVGYYNYTQQVPIDKRTKEHPKTPDKYSKYSRRSWDTLIKMWRKKLHEYDSQENECDEQLSENLSETES